MHEKEIKLDIDYSKLIPLLRESDIYFTGRYGVGTHYSMFDNHLIDTVVAYNKENNTVYSPFEALHTYLDYCEGEL